MSSVIAQLRRFAEATTIHADLVRKHVVTRVLTALVITAVFVFCTTQVISLTSAFVEVETVTDIATPSEELPMLAIKQRTADCFKS